MTESPERIWAMAPPIGEYLSDPPVSPVDHMYLTEYVRADALEAAQKRIVDLEAALRRIDDASNHYAMTTTYSEGTLRYAHQSTRNLARAVLQPEHKEGE